MYTRTVYNHQSNDAHLHVSLGRPICHQYFGVTIDSSVIAEVSES